MSSPFHQLRAVVGAGSGAIVRLPGLLVLTSHLDDAQLDQLIARCTTASAGGNPGRDLPGSLAPWLSAADPTTTVAIVTATAAELVVLVHGVVILAGDLPRFVRSPAGEVWHTETLPFPTSPLTVGVDGAATAPTRPWDLREGVVPGGNVTLVPVLVRAGTPAPAPVPAPPIPPTPSHGGYGGPLSLPVVSRPPIPPTRSEALRNQGLQPQRAPLPVGPVPVPAADVIPEAQGHVCSRGHFNDPRVRFCGVCGIRMDQKTQLLVNRPRPPLGVLVFDDGTTYRVDSSYLVGRAPDSDPRVAQGRVRPLALADPNGRMSRVHAELKVEGWDVYVIDMNSVNGTFVQRPGGGWEPAPAGSPVHVAAGTRVGIGDRSFVFESVFGVT